MHWKLKAAAQNAIACLPSELSYEVYYRVQRLAGGLRRVDPTKVLRAGVATWRQLLDAGADPLGKTFLEVGTGRMVNLPTALWLMGAERTITVDLNPYLKGDLVRESLRYLATNRDQIESLFAELLIPKRLDRLVALATEDASVETILETIGVDYHAPSDAADTGLPDASIDFHTSYTVLEHIPPAVLASIFQEARRLLRPEGLAVHGIDYSDHFSHTDPKLPLIHFLQYPQHEWDRLAGNRYMYMNRLRHHEYLETLVDAGFEVTRETPTIDPRSYQLLTSREFTVDATYADQEPHELATISAWIVARPECAAAAIA